MSSARLWGTLSFRDRAFAISQMGQFARFGYNNQIWRCQPPSDMIEEGRSVGRSLTAAQCRAVRAWFGWAQNELAARANVSVNSVRNFENQNRTVHPNTIAAIRGAIEAAGVSLVFDPEGRATGFTISAD